MTDATPGVDLKLLGWDDHFAQLAAAAAAQNHALGDSIPGRIARVDRGACLVYCQDQLITAASNSLISQDAAQPVTGDWVLASRESGLGWVIDSILPRRTSLIRREPAAEAAEQAIVSNVDVAAIVCGLNQPLHAARLERLLVLAVSGGARPVVVLNKADLSTRRDIKRRRSQITELALDTEVLTTSAVGEVRGLDELEDQLRGHQTLALLGLSGVGKSSLARAMLARGSDGWQAAVDSQLLLEQQQSVRVAGDGDRAAIGDSTVGQHTTVSRHLLVLPSEGVLIDTPGLRSLGLWAADAALDEVFSDIAEAAQNCRFRDCSHRLEPDCAVKSAVEDGSVSQDRLERYLRLWQELSDQTQQREESDRRRSRGRHRQTTSKQVRQKKPTEE